LSHFIFQKGFRFFYIINFVDVITSFGTALLRIVLQQSCRNHINVLLTPVYVFLIRTCAVLIHGNSSIY